MFLYKQKTKEVVCRAKSRITLCLDFLHIFSLKIISIIWGNVWTCFYSTNGRVNEIYFLKNASFLKQELDSISFHYWSLFDGHAGSGAAVVASKLLQHHIVEQLQEIVDILKNSAVPPPTCLGEEPESMNANSRTLTRAASLRGSVGAPGSPGTPSTRFFTEKKISQECLVKGAVETAFREMVSIVWWFGCLWNNAYL